MNNRPNILIFNPDQWRGDVLGFAGNPAAVTPNLDALVAEDAVGFRRAFCQNPVCTPSRCSFMTGWYPHTAGHRTMVHMLRSHEPNLLKTLKGEGYFVWWGGKNDLVPAQHGYADHCDVHYAPAGEVRPFWQIDQQDRWRGRRGDDRFYSFFVGELPGPDDGVYRDRDWSLVEGAVDFLAQAPADRPWCLYLPLLYPHPPYAVEQPWHGMIDRAKLPARAPAPPNDWAGKPSILKGIAERQGLAGWDEPRWTELRAVYYGMCARVDHQLGLVVDALRRTGQYDNTLILFLADHGDFNGDYGLVEKTQNTFEDCLTNVPLVVKPPAELVAQPRVSDALVELIDVPATVYDLAGIDCGYSHFGRSLRTVLTGQDETHREAVFCEGGRRHGETHCMELNSTSAADPDGLYWPRVNLQQSEGPEHTKALMCRTDRYKYVRRLYESDELYDLVEDPQELHNRIDDPDLGPVRAVLAERMLDWMIDSADVVPHDPDQRW